MMPFRLTDEDHIEINRYLERYYGCASYNQIPKTERFYRFINEILNHFQRCRCLLTPADMTAAEYAIHLWEIGPVKRFIRNEVDKVRGIPAHAARQSEFCHCLYCEFFNAGRVVHTIIDGKVLQIRVNGRRSDEPRGPRPSVEPVD